VDYRHRLVFSGVYELPVGRKRQIGANLSRVADAVIGGWQINGIFTAQSGDPLGISATGTAALFSEASRGNANGGNPIVDGDAHSRLDRWFDTSVFSQPAPYTWVIVIRWLRICGIIIRTIWICRCSSNSR
jgi:hypothetical protein